MSTNQKLEALKAGELDKVLDAKWKIATAFAGTLDKDDGFRRTVEFAKTNAAKVEATKAVLDEALIELGALTEHWNGDYASGMEAIERVQGLLINLEAAL
jgi:hypothetical protein